MKRLAPIIALQDGMIEAGALKSKDRTITTQSLLDRLRSIQRHEVTLDSAKFEQITRLNDQQAEILKLLGVRLPGCRSL